MRTAMIAVLSAAFLAPVMVGCDKEVSKTDSTTKNPDGTVKQSEDKTVQHSDGSVTHTTSSENVPSH